MSVDCAEGIEQDWGAAKSCGVLCYIYACLILCSGIPLGGVMPPYLLLEYVHVLGRLTTLCKVFK